jgi:hypothetical protein
MLMKSYRFGNPPRVWPLAAIVLAAISMGCAHGSLEIVDDHGYHHHGYYDDRHDWHGGYYDENHIYHDDDPGWHR